MIAALWGLSVLATVLAWVVARHRPEHRPVAWLLAYGLVSDAVREAIGALVLRPMRAELRGAPFTGWPRVLCDVDNALFLGWTAGVAAVAIIVFSRRRTFWVWIAWALVVAGLAISYPTVRGELLGKVYLACQLAALCVSIGFLLIWYASRGAVRSHHVATGLIVITELTMLAGPYRFGVFTNWDLARLVFVVLYSTLIPVQGFAIWRRT